MDTQKLCLGVTVLLVVDLIWVASAEVSEYLFKTEHFNKPVFSTYFKTTMFTLYLFGFLFWKSWREQCRLTPTYMYIDPNIDNDLYSHPEDSVISDSRYQPIKFHDGGDKSSGTESDDSSSRRARSVRFSKLTEVRQLSESQADDAALARLSYTASLRAQEEAARLANKLSIRQVAKIALQMTVIWFAGNCSYQLALSDTKPAIVNTLSSTASLFTLILAAVFPANSGDRFTISKFVAVLVSIGGIALITLYDFKLENRFPYGALWSLSGAFFYAIYVVMIRRKVENEEKMDMSMFFGFLGLFSLLLLWPLLIVLDYAQLEPLAWPTRTQWTLLLVNGLIGTVLSELLWLLGVFLSSSLIGTLAMSLVIPLTMVADVVIKRVSYSHLLYFGSLPVFASFFAVALFTYKDNWDPVSMELKRLLLLVCSRRQLARLRDVEKEQTESLIGINNDEHDA